MVHGVPCGPVERRGSPEEAVAEELFLDVALLATNPSPGTGTPEPGGLTTRELQLILFGLADLDVVGADVVEVAPAYDHAQITALAAAGLTFDLLAMMARPNLPRGA
ncbi:arginase family protein [Nocardioides sp. SLBN-35]|uniref:arginase family protein n=1 Tax=Nocardioides sp. SLBN-35 TaxID=2768445 RepID=UPI001C92C9A0|nr:arginase family protein [Nocardioides sp. SLBN-35]